MDLDQLLNEAAPAAPTGAGEELRTMARGAERAARPHGRRRKLTVVGGLLAVLAIGGAAAAGTAVFQPRSELKIEGNRTCHLDWHLYTRAEVDGDLKLTGKPRAVGDEATQREAVAIANEFLATWRLPESDLDEAVADYQRHEKIGIDQAAPGDAAPPAEGDDLTLTAMAYRAYLDVSAHLRSRGHSPDSIAWGHGLGCTK